MSKEFFESLKNTEHGTGKETGGEEIPTQRGPRVPDEESRDTREIGRNEDSKDHGQAQDREGGSRT